MKAHAIVGAPIWTRIEDAFRKWVRSDSYGDGQTGDKRILQANSVRELIGSLISYERQHGMWQGQGRAGCNLDMTVDELLSREILLQDRHTRRSVEVIFLNALCFAHLAALIAEASRVSGTQAEAERQWADLAAAAGCESWAGVRARVEQTANGLELSRALLEVLRQEISAKHLWDFFRNRPREDGYVSWYPDAETGLGDPLKPSQIDTVAGIVRLRVSRYEDTSDAGIRSYEWNAELRNSPRDESLPLAVATGMVYILPRRNGCLLCSPSDLRWAADAVSDTDVRQVIAFLEQHEDAELILALGDLCFIWLWERRAGSEKGCGAQLLSAAMQDLKRRFRSLKTLVVNLEPAQFSGGALDSDPAEIVAARHEASEKLEAYIRAVRPEMILNGVLRLIAMREMSPDDTLVELGKADLLGR